MKPQKKYYNGLRREKTRQIFPMLSETVRSNVIRKWGSVEDKTIIQIGLHYNNIYLY